jgi:hypothetical protein
MISGQTGKVVLDWTSLYRLLETSKLLILE